MGQTKKNLIYGLLGVNHVAMGAMARGKSLYFVTSMLLCARLHELKFVLWRWQTVLPKFLISVAHAPLGLSTIFQEDPVKLG